VAKSKRTQEPRTTPKREPAPSETETKQLRLLFDQMLDQSTRVLHNALGLKKFIHDEFEAQCAPFRREPASSKPREVNDPVVSADIFLILACPIHMNLVAYYCTGSCVVGRIIQAGATSIFSKIHAYSWDTSPVPRECSPSRSDLTP
jgi:hypothetical protein